MKLSSALLLSLAASVSLAIDVSHFEIKGKALEVGSYLRNLLRDSERMGEPEKPKEDVGKKPDFCHGLDCPDFQDLNNTKSKKYEIREYEASRWVSTQMLGMKYDKAVEKMFMKLFNYIEGKNEKKMKIAMTAPVLVRVIPGQGPACESNFTMSFFIAPKVREAPEPSEKDVFLSGLHKQKVFVSSFGGRPDEKEWIENGDDLAAALEKDERKFDDSYFYTAGYDSPFRLFKRHNEIWFVAKE